VTRTKLSARDLEVLTAIGRFRMLTRPQVKRWFFESVSEPVVTRFIGRGTRDGLLGVERLHGNGTQLFWLTRKGRDVLVAHGVAAAELFPTSGPVAAKDFEHTAEIGNVAVWLMKRMPAPDELLPAWALQRYFSGQLQAIPDLLALWRTPAAALAVEVDLGTEPVATVLLPKLALLSRSMGEHLPGESVTIMLPE
jgi:protein involved in plasmid replication-relaxation